MQLTHSFRVPVPIDEAWRTLRDIERVAPCMPGATLDSVDGDEFTGRVKVKVGPITVTYRGEARFVDVDESAYSATIEASGRETKGSGTARATVRADLRAEGDETEVTVNTDLAVTGRPAQFGRGVMADVGAKLIGQFADCLSAQLGGGEEPAAAAAAPSTEVTAGAPSTPAPDGPGPMPASSTPPPAPRRQESEAIDLLEVAGGPLAQRLGPVVGGIVGVLVLWLLWTRRRARKQVARLSARLERAEHTPGITVAKGRGGAKGRAARRGRRRGD